jgi:ubiquitin carboxyl-terminal hydrolase L5
MVECADGGIQFNLLALVRDPLAVATENLARNIKFLKAIDDRFSELHTCWDGKLRPDTLQGESPEYLIDTSLLESTEFTQQERQDLDLIYSGEEAQLLAIRDAAISDQGGLRAALVDEKASAETDEEKAKDRRNDYGPLIQTWLKMIAENGCVKELLDGQS